MAMVMAVVVVRRRGRKVSLLHKEVDETLEYARGLAKASSVKAMDKQAMKAKERSEAVKAEKRAKREVYGSRGRRRQRRRTRRRRRRRRPRRTRMRR